jgi:hypothetical protein
MFGDPALVGILIRRTTTVRQDLLTDTGSFRKPLIRSVAACKSTKSCLVSEVIAPGGYGPWICRLSGLSTNSVRVAKYAKRMTVPARPPHQ